MASELELLQIKRRRGNVLKLIRQNHEEQLQRWTDSEVLHMMQSLGAAMSPRQMMTMLQDLQTLGLIAFKQRFCDFRERQVAEEIMLTPVGLALTTRRKDTDEVIFD